MLICAVAFQGYRSWNALRGTSRTRCLRRLLLQSVGKARLGINNLLTGAEPLLDHADDGGDV